MLHSRASSSSYSQTLGWLEKPSRSKHYSLFGPPESYEENEVFEYGNCKLKIILRSFLISVQKQTMANIYNIWACSMKNYLVINAWHNKLVCFYVVHNFTVVLTKNRLKNTNLIWNFCTNSCLNKTESDLVSMSQN